MHETRAPYRIVGDEGFYVQPGTGRTGLTYGEGGRTLSVESEMLFGDEGMAIYADSIKRWDPPDDSPIGDAERQQIVKRIREAFAFIGLGVVVH